MDFLRVTLCQERRQVSRPLYLLRFGGDESLPNFSVICRKSEKGRILPASLVLSVLYLGRRRVTCSPGRSGVPHGPTQNHRPVPTTGSPQVSCRVVRGTPILPSPSRTGCDPRWKTPWSCVSWSASPRRSSGVPSTRIVSRLQACGEPKVHSETLPLSRRGDPKP